MSSKDRLREARRSSFGAPRVFVFAVCLIAAVVGCRARRPTLPPAKATIADRVAQFGPPVRARLVPYFEAAGVPYPPARFVLLGLKRERALQLYAAARPEDDFVFVRTYAVLGASGHLGPKLREGDRQVPEGVYRIEYLNPNSISHLSLALSYPNPFDRAYGAEDGRAGPDLGGEIMIHGGSGSIGCLAVGDQAAEDLFVLAAVSHWEEARVIVAPVDFRRAELPVELRPTTDWEKRLYVWLRCELAKLPLPPPGAGTLP